MDSQQLLLNLQQLLAPLDIPLRLVSQYGYSKYMLLFAGILYWSGYRQLGTRLAIGTEVSTLVFGSCRQFFASTRPYWIYPELFNDMTEKGYGMPSGHTQNAVVFWGLIANTLKRPWLWLLAIIMIATTGVSRMYLGVHFPAQVLAGLVGGIIILTLFIKLEPVVIRFLSTRTTLTQCLWILLASSLPLVFVMVSREILDIGQGNGAAMPYGIICKFTGLLAGMGLGVLMAPKISSPSLQLLLTQAFPGVVSVALLYQLIPLLPIPDQQPVLFYFGRWLEAFLIALWGAGVWPLLHKLLLKF